MHQHPLRPPRRLPLRTAIGELSDQRLFLAVDADHRLPRSQLRLGLLVEVAELGVTIGMLRAFQVLRVRCSV
jgi:hypothetical protein